MSNFADKRFFFLPEHFKELKPIRAIVATENKDNLSRVCITLYEFWGAGLCSQWPWVFSFVCTVGLEGVTMHIIPLHITYHRQGCDCCTEVVHFMCDLYGFIYTFQEIHELSVLEETTLSSDLSQGYALKALTG